MEKIIGDYKIVIDYDDNIETPRTSEDNLCTMVCFHSKHNLGDEHTYDYHEYDNWDDLRKAIIKAEDPAMIFNLYFLDHSGQSISTGPFTGHGWDSGKVGFIFVSKETVRNEYNVKRISKRLLSIVKTVIDAEVKTYDQYLKGEVYKFKVYKNGQLIDKSFGYYGKDVCLEAAMECVEQ